MIELNLKIDQGTPQYSCNSCYNCQSSWGKSLCKIKNRGCCWYFPKFTLYDIHKMTKDEEGLQVLNKILSLPEVEIHKYYIHAKGYFDKEGYEKYIKSKNEYDSSVHDKTIYFRACPFVKEGVGCELPKKFRSNVCNFFICNEVIKVVEKNKEFNNYIKERDSFDRWINWENNSLEQILHENKLNLIDNFEGVINLLKNLPLDKYEYGQLNPIVV